MQTIIKQEDLDAFNQEISTKVAAHNARLAEANKQAPTDQDIQNEYYQLRAEYEKRGFNAKQSEATVNRAADRAKHFQNQLKLLKGTIPAGEYDTLLVKFRAGERVYRHAETFRKIGELEEDLATAIDFFNRMKLISVDTAKTLQAFEEHGLARLQELKPIVAEQDAAYSFIKGTSRSKGWGRW